MATRMLVPLDGSELAEQALPCASMLASGMGADLVLLRAVSVPPEEQELLTRAEVRPETPSASLETEAAGYLQRVASRLHDVGVRAELVVRSGPAAETIVDYVKQGGIKQIVMATHGYGGISRWIHGSVAERVLQTATVPILLIRAQKEVPDVAHKPAQCRRILVPLDASALAEQVLPPVTAVAKALCAEVILFRVLTLFTSVSLTGEWHMPLENVVEIARQDAQQYLARVAEDLQAQGIAVSIDFQIGAVANAIIDYADMNSIDLTAMCTHGRTGLARWALGSVADRVLRAGSTPLLLVRAR